jgi:hypothetical protein
LICVNGLRPAVTSDRSRGFLAFHADAGEHFRPELADLEMAAFDRGGGGVTKRKQVGVLEKQNLCLHHAAAFELDFPQGKRKRILR